MIIKKKIITGFVLIGLLLLIAGISTSKQLAEFNKDTAKELQTSEEVLSLVEKLLDISQQRNTAFMNSIEDSTGVFDSVYSMSQTEFDKTLILLKKYDKHMEVLQRIFNMNVMYNRNIMDNKDTADFKWAIGIYSSSYYNLTNTIKDYMVEERDESLKYTSTLETNVYRITMLGIISFAFGIVLLVVFYFMMNYFFINPVLSMEKSLADFIKYGRPYNVKINSQDEIQRLSEHIGELCSRNR